MNHTKGKVIVDIESDGNLWITNESEIIANINCDQVTSNRYEPTKEQKANAELIAEAFNVTNETGLTPKQLAEQNEDLLMILKAWGDVYNKHGVGGGGKELYDECQKSTIRILKNSK